jgi:hypothetical protein
MALVECQGILQIDRSFNHKVGAILSDASVSDESKDVSIVRVVVLDNLYLFALE